MMQHIFEREFRREKMLAQAKIQAEKAKAPKKEKEDNTKKKEEEQKAKLNDLEEAFFKKVADGDEAALADIKARGGDMGAREEAAAVTSAPEAAADASAASPAKQPVNSDVAPGDYTFKGSFTKAGKDTPVSFKFKVLEGGIIEAQPSADVKFSLNGVIQNNKFVLAQQFEGGSDSANFDGVFESDKLVKGTYKSNRSAEYDAEGTFTLERQ